jgi:hypothetical protein
MSVYAGPEITNSNLVLCLDAGNTKSYPGSGTSWTDLAQGLVFSSNGTLTPLETKAGALSFAFNSSGYWTYSTTPSLVDMAGECTLVYWYYNEGLVTRRTIFEKAGTIYNSYEQEIAMTCETNNDISYYSRYNAYDYAYTNPADLNAWNMIGIKMSNGKTTATRSGLRSKNGSAWETNYVARSATAITLAGQIRIGTGYAGTMDTGNLALLLVYTKMLTDAEIKELYNSTRGRFGL